MAFSFAGMANDKQQKENLEEKVVLKTDCVQVANALMVLHPDAWNDNWTYITTWIIIYNNCQASNP